ncbi:hypothetical protein GCM10008967_31430 [Bacillus carboniphilus]|uniref:DUF7147 domain-containing protein n=1 Tax=Bacillus carboniphilus TaxID=86663 RepID=A0ABP3GBM5_9BACI
MIQRFIELGEGYSDIYELLEIVNRNQDRIQHFLLMKTEENKSEFCSLVVILKATQTGNFQPLYICKEGIPYKENSQRIQLFREAAQQIGKSVIELEVRPSSSFADPNLFYQYLIGILRMNRYILPLG